MSKQPSNAVFFPVKMLNNVAKLPSSIGVRNTISNWVANYD